MASDLPFHCAQLKADFSSRESCEMNRLRAAALLAAGRTWIGPLTHCQECQGKELEERVVECDVTSPTVEALMPETKYCKNHPDRPQHNGTILYHWDDTTKHLWEITGLV